jgi:hypothetical protein
MSTKKATRPICPLSGIECPGVAKCAPAVMSSRYTGEAGVSEKENGNTEVAGCPVSIAVGSLVMLSTAVHALLSAGGTLPTPAQQAPHPLSNLKLDQE